MENLITIILGVALGFWFGIGVYQYLFPTRIDMDFREDGIVNIKNRSFFKIKVMVWKPNLNCGGYDINSDSSIKFSSK